VIGAGYLAIVCLFPELLISYAAVPFYFGGTSLLIVVSVTMTRWRRYRDTCLRINMKV